MEIALFVIGAYILGSVPFGYIIARTQHIDIRKKGSGNIGGTNVFRVMGKGYGVLVMILDCLKGFIPTIIALHMYPNTFYPAFIGLAVMLGHIFSIFLKGKGGKGVAPYAGVLIAVIPPYISLLFFLLWIIILVMSRLMSLTNILFFLTVPLYFMATMNFPFFLVSLIAYLLIFIKHSENVVRLIKRTESKLF